jgi:hypothetical protein
MPRPPRLSSRYSQRNHPKVVVEAGAAPLRPLAFARGSTPCRKLHPGEQRRAWRDFVAVCTCTWFSPARVRRAKLGTKKTNVVVIFHFSVSELFFIFHFSFFCLISGVLVHAPSTTPPRDPNDHTKPHDRRPVRGRSPRRGGGRNPRAAGPRGSVLAAFLSISCRHYRTAVNQVHAPDAGAGGAAGRARRAGCSPSQGARAFHPLA